MLYECLEIKSLYNVSNAHRIPPCIVSPHNSLTQSIEVVDMPLEGTYHFPGSSSCSPWHYAVGRNSADNAVVQFWSNPSIGYRQPRISDRTWELTGIRIDST